VNTVSSFNRRDFLRLSGVTCSGLILGFSAEAETSSPENFNPDIFLTLEPSGTIHIYAHRSEMGTGIRTVLPMVVADELGADWDDVDIRQATGDKKFGSQNTDGSRSIWKFFDRMRTAGATAGFLLNQAAAARWNVDPSTCRRDASHVIHKASGKRIAFKELVGEAAKLPLPNADELTFKAPEERTYIGKGKKGR
jgi:isoquinoline 1-oxidoreductase beta subunit